MTFPLIVLNQKNGKPIGSARTRLFYYTDGRVKYECWNLKSNILNTSNDWLITKTIYGENTEETQVLQGAVNTETVINALAWSI